MAIGIKTRKGIPVTDESGANIGYLFFDPADPALIAKIDAFATKMSTSLDGYTDDADAESKFRGVIEADTTIRNEFDLLFGSGASALLFRDVGPLTITESGEQYAFELLQQLLDLISAEMQTAAEASKARVDKRLAGYTAAEAETPHA